MNEPPSPPQGGGESLGRKHFWRACLREVLAVRDEMRGVPQESLDNLAALPDSVVKEMVPVWRNPEAVDVREDGLYITSGRPPVKTRVCPLTDQERLMVDQYGCGRNLQTIAEHLVGYAGLNAAAAFEAAKELFVRLARRGYCHPAASHRQG